MPGSYATECKIKAPANMTKREFGVFEQKLWYYICNNGGLKDVVSYESLLWNNGSSQQKDFLHAFSFAKTVLGKIPEEYSPSNINSRYFYAKWAIFFSGIEQSAHTKSCICLWSFLATKGCNLPSTFSMNSLYHKELRLHHPSTFPSCGLNWMLKKW